MQRAFHFALLGDIDKRSLIPHEFPRRVANGRGSVQRNDLAVTQLVLEGDLASAQESGLVQAGAFGHAVLSITVKRGKLQL